MKSTTTSRRDIPITMYVTPEIAEACRARAAAQARSVSNFLALVARDAVTRDDAVAQAPTNARTDSLAAAA